jgi:protein involved in polysaccharide export with SLBB domain
MAGGINSSVANKIYVIRRPSGDEDAAVIQVSLHDAKRDGTENLRLASGDIVSVEQTLPTVALDAIKSFVRIGFSSRVPLF